MSFGLSVSSSTVSSVLLSLFLFWPAYFEEKIQCTCKKDVESVRCEAFQLTEHDDGRPIYRDHLKRLSQQACTHKVRLRFCAWFLEEIDSFSLVFWGRQTDVPIVPARAVVFHFDLRFLGYDFGVNRPPAGARFFVVQTAVCVTKTHLAGPQNRRCPYPEHLHSIHASVREGIAR